MDPINVQEDKMAILANTFGCQVGTLPFIYLGLPLGTTKAKMQDFSHILDRVERKLSSCATYLSYGGRLTMINAVHSALPTFYMCYLKIPITVINNIDRACKHCLW